LPGRIDVTQGQDGLRIQALHVDLANRHVLRGVDLHVPPGRVTGLIGPNGAGKTTLLRATLGVIPARAGTVTLDGAPLQPGRAPVGYVPQRHEFAWDFPVTIRGAVLSGLTRRQSLLRRACAAGRRAADDALAWVRLADLADRPVGQLSGGQRQRVLLARALVLRPSLLLLDEPFVGIDAPTQELLLDLLRALRDRGTAILVTTHDLAAATALSDRMCLLNGRVLAEGPPEVLRDPALWLETFGVRGAMARQSS
jgi:manganese/iron transport system ATP-binding protein